MFAQEHILLAFMHVATHTHAYVHIPVNFHTHTRARILSLPPSLSYIHVHMHTDLIFTYAHRCRHTHRNIYSIYSCLHSHGRDSHEKNTNLTKWSKKITNNLTNFCHHLTWVYNCDVVITLGVKDGGVSDNCCNQSCRHYRQGLLLNLWLLLAGRMIKGVNINDNFSN